MKTKMKMYISFALIALTLAGAVTAGAAFAARGGIGQSAGFDAADGYVLREHEGHLAIYYAGFDRAPAVITEIEVHMLPAADRELLAAGMPVETREELLLLLEDLGS